MRWEIIVKLLVFLELSSNIFLFKVGYHILNNYSSIQSLVIWFSKGEELKVFSKILLLLSNRILFSVSKFKRWGLVKILLLVLEERFKIFLKCVVKRLESLFVWSLFNRIVWRRYSIMEFRIVLKILEMCIGRSFLYCIS
jgi:hypothetical protein